MKIAEEAKWNRTEWEVNVDHSRREHLPQHRLSGELSYHEETKDDLRKLSTGWRCTPPRFLAGYYDSSDIFLCPILDCLWLKWYFLKHLMTFFRSQNRMFPSLRCPIGHLPTSHCVLLCTFHGTISMHTYAFLKKSQLTGFRWRNKFKRVALGYDSL